MGSSAVVHWPGFGAFSVGARVQFPVEEHIQQMEQDTHTHTHTHTQWDNINLIKGGNPAICNNMGESGGHYAK